MEIHTDTPTDELLTEPHITELVRDELEPAGGDGLERSQVDAARKAVKDFAFGWCETELDGANARTEMRATA